jgi:hypothetical protein
MQVVVTLSVLRNYRGERVSIPEAAVPLVLEKLGRAAYKLGKLPAGSHVAQTYQQLGEALHQLGIGEETLNC